MICERCVFDSHCTAKNGKKDVNECGTFVDKAVVGAGFPPCNHEEAYQSASYKINHSNMARSYIELKDNRDRLVQLIELFISSDFKSYEDWKDKIKNVIGEIK